MAETIAMHISQYEKSAKWGRIMAKWPKIAPTLDAEWRKGEAWSAKRQKTEDDRLRKGKRKQVFGY